MYSGDGGWAKFIGEVSRRINALGISVVGVNSLKYFWKYKSPNTASEDLQSIIHNYRKEWQKQKIVLIGYSYGADVLPFLVARLPDAILRDVQSVILLNPGQYVEFEVRVSDWVGWGHRAKDMLPLKPEIERINKTPIFCVYSSDDMRESLCTKLPPNQTRVTCRELPGDHHFNHDYSALMRTLGDLLTPERPSMGSQ